MATRTRADAGQLQQRSGLGFRYGKALTRMLAVEPVWLFADRDVRVQVRRAWVLAQHPDRRSELGTQVAVARPGRMS